MAYSSAGSGGGKNSSMASSGPYRGQVRLIGINAGIREIESFQEAFLSSQTRVNPMATTAIKQRKLSKHLQREKWTSRLTRLAGSSSTDTERSEDDEEDEHEARMSSKEASTRAESELEYMRYRKEMISKPQFRAQIIRERAKAKVLMAYRGNGSTTLDKTLEDAREADDERSDNEDARGVHNTRLQGERRKILESKKSAEVGGSGATDDTIGKTGGDRSATTLEQKRRETPIREAKKVSFDDEVAAQMKAMHSKAELEGDSDWDVTESDDDVIDPALTPLRTSIVIEMERRRSEIISRAESDARKSRDRTQEDSIAQFVTDSTRLIAELESCYESELKYKLRAVTMYQKAVKRCDLLGVWGEFERAVRTDDLTVSVQLIECVEKMRAITQGGSSIEDYDVRFNEIVTQIRYLRRDYPQEELVRYYNAGLDANVFAQMISMQRMLEAVPTTLGAAQKSATRYRNDEVRGQRDQAIKATYKGAETKINPPKETGKQAKNASLSYYADGGPPEARPQARYRPCWTWQQTGACARGDKCKFHHGSDAAGGTPMMPTPPPMPTVTSTSPKRYCWEFQKTGECRADNCRFWHRKDPSAMEGGDGAGAKQQNVDSQETKARHKGQSGKNRQIAYMTSVRSQYVRDGKSRETAIALSDEDMEDNACAETPVKGTSACGTPLRSRPVMSEDTDDEEEDIVVLSKGKPDEHGRLHGRPQPVVSSIWFNGNTPNAKEINASKMVAYGARWCEARDVPGKGVGIFATEEIAKGDRVCLFSRFPALTTEEFQSAHEPNKFTFETGGKHWYPRVTERQLGGLLNDGLDDRLNNCRYKISRETECLTVETTKNVKAGTELQAAYGREYWMKHGDVLSSESKEMAEIYYELNGRVDECGGSSSESDDEDDSDYDSECDSDSDKEEAEESHSVPEGQAEKKCAYACSKHPSEKNTLMLDSGATIAVIRDISLFEKTWKTTNPVNIVGIDRGSDVSTYKAGTLRFPFEDVSAIYVKEATANILPQGQMMDHFHVAFDEKENKYTLVHKTTGVRVIFECNRDRIYMMARIEAMCNAALQVAGEIWSEEQRGRAKEVMTLHESLSHMPFATMAAMLSTGAIETEHNLTGADVRVCQKLFGPCNACIFARALQAGNPRRSHAAPAKEAGNRLHMDIMYMSTTKAKKKNETVMFLLAVDEKTGFVIGVQLTGKDIETVKEAIEGILGFWGRQEKRVLELRMDREPAFQHLRNWMASQNIKASYTQAEGHVRRAERTIRTIKGRVRATLAGLPYKLPYSLYGKLISFVINSLNMTQNKNTAGASPISMVMGRRVRERDRQLTTGFGATVLATKQYIAQCKDDEYRANLGIVVGRSHDTEKGMEVYMIATKRIITRKTYFSVKMNEDMVSLLGATDVSTVMQMRVYSEDGEDDDSEIDEGMEPVEVESEDESEAESEGDDQEETAKSHESRTEARSEPEEEKDTREREDEVEVVASELRVADEDYWTTQDNMHENVISGDIVECGKEPPVEMYDGFIAGDDDNPEEEEVESEPRRSERTRKPCKRYAFLTSANMSIKQALGDKPEQAKAAVAKELRQMYKMQVWEVVPATENVFGDKNAQIIPSSMFLKEKYKANGDYDKMKARLVANGNMQKIMDDTTADQFSSPTVNLHNVLMMLAVAAGNKMEFRSLDVTGAYLHAVMPEEKKVYMWLNKEVSSILIDSFDSDQAEERQKTIGSMRDGRILTRLRKYLYGLKESSRAWYETVGKVLMTKCGMDRCEMDGCLFKKVRGEKVIIVLLYVDDMLLLYTHEELYFEIKSDLKKVYPEMTESEKNACSFIGMALTRESDGDIKVKQTENLTNVIEKILGDDMHMTRVTPASMKGKEIPGDDVQMTAKEKSTALSQTMSLMYLALRSRPDILYKTVLIASDLHKEKVGQLRHIKRVAAYLNRTKEACLTFSHKADLVITCYADAAFDTHEKSRGHTGVSIWMDSKCQSAAFLNKSAKQKVATNSSMEAELIALHEAGALVLYARRVLKFIPELVPDQSATMIWQDNNQCILLSRNPIMATTGRARFIDRKYFTTYDNIEAGELMIDWCGTEFMWADSHTKDLQGRLFKDCNSKVMNYHEW